MSNVENESIGSKNEDGLDHGGIDELVVLDKPWWKYRHFQHLHFCIFLITLTATNNGYDGSMLNGLQSLSVWRKDMGNPKGAILGALNSGNVFGAMLSSVVASYLADKFGRKWCIVGGNVVCIIGAVLQGASTNYAFFLVSRIILGFGSAVASVSSPPLISELSYPTYRPTATTFYNVCWYLGAIVAAWVTFGTRTIASKYCWKIPSYLQAFFPLCQIVFFWTIPESPRYLASKGRIAEADKILSRIHTGNAQDERSRKLVQFELEEIQTALELEKLTANSKYLDFLTIPSFRKRIFLTSFVGVMMQLSGNGLVSYYLNKVLNSIGITSEREQLEINGLLMVYNFVICCVIACVVGYFKRRTLFLFSVSFMLATYVVWTALSAVNQQRDFKDKSFANGVLAMIFLYYLAYNIGINGLPFLYVTEILPYSHRAKGLNIFGIIGSLVSIFNGFVNPVAMDAIEWKYYIVYCCVLAVELVVVYFFFVETSGYTLEEVAKVFGDDPDNLIVTVPATSEKLHVSHHEDATDSSDEMINVSEKV